MHYEYNLNFDTCLKMYCLQVKRKLLVLQFFIFTFCDVTNGEAGRGKLQNETNKRCEVCNNSVEMKFMFPLVLQ